jgi:WhiB family redox-sensing transcriptional regulator
VNTGNASHRYDPEPTDMGWRDQAACLGEDPELFFPSASAVDQVAEALAVCDRCDVQAECLEWSLVTYQDNGVWGGRTEDERRGLRRSRQRRHRLGQGYRNDLVDGEMPKRITPRAPQTVAGPSTEQLREQIPKVLAEQPKPVRPRDLAAMLGASRIRVDNALTTLLKRRVVVRPAKGLYTLRGVA